MAIEERQDSEQTIQAVESDSKHQIMSTRQTFSTVQDSTRELKKKLTLPALNLEQHLASKMLGQSLFFRCEVCSFSTGKTSHHRTFSWGLNVQVMVCRFEGIYHAAQQCSSTHTKGSSKKCVCNVMPLCCILCSWSLEVHTFNHCKYSCLASILPCLALRNSIHWAATSQKASDSF